MPFSNTFGYGIAKLFGLQKVFNNILKPKPSNNTANQTPLEKHLEDIYNDESLLINSIPNSGVGFDNFWTESKILFKPDADMYKDELRELVKLKNIIAELIWFALTGMLVISASYNYIIKAACTHSIAEMEQKHSDYEKEIAPMIAKEKQEPRIYSTYE